MGLHPNIIDAMAAAGATLDVVRAACRAAWELAEGAGELARQSAAHRQRVSRSSRKHHQAQCEPDLVDAMQEADYGDAAIACAEAEQLVTPVTVTAVTAPHKKEDSSLLASFLPSSLRSEEEKEDGGGGCARAIPMITISEEAFAIAAKVSTIVGIDPDPQATPPGWCGAAMWAQGKLNAGIPEAVVLAGVRKGMASKSDPGAPYTPFYFDKPIARSIAEMNRPQPVIEILGPSNGSGKSNGYPRKRHSSDIAREMAEEIRAIERAAGYDGPYQRFGVG